jgi:hypothetical protein
MSQSRKLRYKGWRPQLDRIEQGLEMLILGTPTSELRNKLTDIQIKIGELKEFDAKQKEVL